MSTQTTARWRAVKGQGQWWNLESEHSRQWWSLLGREQAESLAEYLNALEACTDACEKIDSMRDWGDDYSVVHDVLPLVAPALNALRSLRDA